MKGDLIDDFKIQNLGRANYQGFAAKHNRNEKTGASPLKVYAPVYSKHYLASNN